MVVDAMRSGATNINLSVALDADRLGAATLHDALEGMMRAAQRDLGTDASTWSLALGVDQIPVTRTARAGSSEDLTESTSINTRTAKRRK